MVAFLVGNQEVAGSTPVPQTLRLPQIALSCWRQHERGVGSGCNVLAVTSHKTAGETQINVLAPTCAASRGKMSDDRDGGTIESKFGVGATLSLKSGGPKMTVTSIIFDVDDDGTTYVAYQLAWFDQNKLRRDCFPELSLMEKEPEAQ